MLAFVCQTAVMCDTQTRDGNESGSSEEFCIFFMDVCKSRICARSETGLTDHASCSTHGNSSVGKDDEEPESGGLLGDEVIE